MGNILNIGAGQDYRRTVLIGKNASFDIPSEMVLERDSHLELVIIVLPGVSGNLSLTIDLAGEGAEAVVSGIYLCPKDENVGISVNMHHKVPYCLSRQLFKGIAGGNSRVDFYGKIIVDRDAQKTEAYQENHNLLLSENAKVETKPQLEIYADDVKCSHGATIGRLNEEEQFYMRSRGISLDEARILQMISFVSPVLGHIGNDEERERIASVVDSAIRSI